MKKCMVLLLALLLALSSTGCISTIALYHMLDAETIEYEQPTQEAKATAKPASPAAPTPDATAAAPLDTQAPRGSVSFAEMEYVRPDTDALIEKLTSLAEDAKNGTKSETWFDRFDEAMALYNDAESQLSLAYLLYAFDVTEDYYQGEYEDVELALLEIDVLMSDAAIAIVESDALGAQAKARWGEDFVATAYLSAQLNSLDVQDRMEEEVALELDYDELLTTFVYKENNRTWTLEDLAPAFYAGEIDYEDYFRLYDAYCAALNQEAGRLYQELLAVRSEIAGQLGYGNFAAYRYECYERDFTVDDAKALHAAVKKDIVPLYVEATTSLQEETWALSDMTFPFESYLANLESAANDFSPRLYESLRYMLDNDLYDFSVSEKKMEGSFTTYLSNYHAPFIFSQWEESSSDVGTVIHELGHFTNDYFNASVGWSGGYSLDLAEVDSQGLELLMMKYYDAFYGKNADAAEASMLIDAMYAVVSGCMEDEFQQYAYENPTASLDELNDYYLSLAEDYGFVDLYGYTGKEWTLVPHSFQSPMYYISYAASMLLSLELWAGSETDYDAARDAYWKILDRGSYDRFRSVAKASGLADPILPTSVAAISQALRTKLGL